MGKVPRRGPRRSGMAETVETQPGGLREGVKDGMHELREDVSRDKLEDKLQTAVKEKPLLRHLLDLRIVLKAVAIAVVVALIIGLLMSFKAASIPLVVVFIGAWLALAARDYNRRRPTKPVDEDSGE